MADLLIRGGLVCDGGAPHQADLLVDGGRVAAVLAPGQADPAGAESVVDAGGLWVLPGRVDPHVHMMDPGPTHREDFITGSEGAVLGGCTTVIDHPRTEPTVLTADILRQKAAYLKGRSYADYGLFGGGQEDNIGELEGMWKAGALAFKAFTCNLHGVPQVRPEQMRELFRKVASFGGVVLVHAEDEEITKANEQRLRAAGRTDGGVTAEWRSLDAEYAAASDVLAAAQETGCRVILAHASHPKIASLVGEVRGRGYDVHCESCPQYFYLSEEIVRERGPWAKFTPPAREAAAHDQLWRQLEFGIIDTITTDHAPATVAEKKPGEQDIWQAPFGVPGIQTTMPLMLEAVHQGHVSLEAVVRAMSVNPARLWNLYPRKGHLGVGADADIALVDPGAEWTIRGAQLVSKAGWTPYEGQKIHGAIVSTYVRGQLVAHEGRVVRGPDTGIFITRPY